MLRLVFATFLLLVPAFAGAGSVYDEANAAYRRTDYERALRLLNSAAQQDARSWALMGMASFGLTDYNKATEAFEHAVQLEPRNSDYVHWLGKTWGRRAETASPFTAPVYASRARTQFEKAVLLDSSDKEALNDLFDYYLEAPGFLGGGLNRAEQLVNKISQLDQAEGHYARAQLADKRKQFDEAEEHLKQALELAPRQVGRLIDLAMYVSKRGRPQESEDYFAKAEKLAPDSPRILYNRAETYIRDKRNLDQARAMLKKYIGSQLTPDDPPREKAEELLRRAGA